MTLRPGSTPLRVPFDSPADAVWVFFVKPPLPEDGERDPAGLAKVSLTLIAADGVEINESLLSEQQNDMLSTGGPVDANAFMELVGRAVAEGWIANGEMK